MEEEKLCVECCSRYCCGLEGMGRLLCEGCDCDSICCELFGCCDDVPEH